MKVATAVLAVFVIVYVGIHLSRFKKADYTVQTVFSQTIEDNLSVTGMFFRDEETFEIGKAGIVSCNYAVGEKVSSTSRIASVYKSQSAVDRQREIENLQETLTSLEKAQTNSQTTDAIRPETLNGMIGEFAAKLIADRDNKDLSSLRELRSDLTEIYARREIIVGTDVDYTSQILQIKERLSELEGYGSEDSQAVYTNVSGYFVDHCDGYEKICTDRNLEDLRASELDGLVKNYKGYSADTGRLRVVTSQKWQFVLTVSEQESYSIREGSTIQIRFSGLGDTVRATVTELRRDPGSGRFLVILQGDTVTPFLLESRVQAAELLVRSYSGLKVPKEAIRFNENGQMGVYVILMGKMYFRAVDEIYENESFIICPPDYQSEDGTPTLKMYDTIILGGMNLYEQKPA